MSNKGILDRLDTLISLALLGMLMYSVSLLDPVPWCAMAVILMAASVTSVLPSVADVFRGDQ